MSIKLSARDLFFAGLIVSVSLYGCSRIASKVDDIPVPRPPVGAVDTVVGATATATTVIATYTAVDGVYKIYYECQEGRFKAVNEGNKKLSPKTSEELQKISGKDLSFARNLCNGKLNPG
jgi:hypothetical protein